MPVSVLYCEGWDPGTRAPVGAMPEAEARERDLTGAKYAVLLMAGTAPAALLHVAWDRGYLGVFQFDGEARRIREFDFRLTDEPGRLLWRGFTHWLLESPQDPEYSGRAWRFEVTIDPRGWARQAFHADGEGRFETQWEMPGNLRTIGRAPFGAWRSYPGTGSAGDGLDLEPALLPASPSAAAGPRWTPPTPLQPVNLEALFTAGAMFRTTPDGYGGGLDAVVRQPHEAGLLRVPTGQVIAGDPLVWEVPEPFTVTVPPGDYPVAIGWAGWAAEPGATVTAVRVLISDKPAATWEMGLLPDQDVRMLPEDGYFGFGVDSGIGAFLDASGRPSLPPGLRETFEAEGTDPLPEVPVPGCFAMWTEDTASSTNMVAYRAGIGDGEYPVWIGRSDDGQVVSLVADMLLFRDAELISPPATPGARYVLPSLPGPEGNRTGTAAASPATARDIDEQADEIVARAGDIRASQGQRSEVVSKIAETLTDRAAAHREAEEYEEALGLLDNAVRIAPGDAWAVGNRALVLADMERYDKAIEGFTRAIELDPGQTWIFAYRGDAYRATERYPQALADFGRALESDPGDAWAIGSRGETYQEMERYPEALADFDRALEIDATLAWVCAYRGEVHAALGNHAAAAADSTRAAEIDPSYHSE